MVDVGRNPHSLGSLKEAIDLFWFYKVDSIQLHLSDDQRFAFPSKAYPRLVTERGKITWEQIQSPRPLRCCPVFGRASRRG